MTTMSIPSVLAQGPATHFHNQSMDSFGVSVVPESSEAQSRRQRIAMACQYCRHRKIRCCGGAPCRNCSRSQKQCEYAPVPEEVNRATREKKAVAKAVKHHTPTSHYSPTLHYSPYFIDQPVCEVPTRIAHRRTVSTPNYFVEPPASQWTPTPPYPSVLEPATQTQSLNTSYSTPNIPQTYLRPLPQPLTPLATDSSTPASYYTPSFHTPSQQASPQFYSYSPNPYLPTQNPSPVFADSSKVVGLGIGMPQDVYHTPLIMSEQYFMSQPPY